jgi:hypothetical protein
LVAVILATAFGPSYEMMRCYTMLHERPSAAVIHSIGKVVMARRASLVAVILVVMTLLTACGKSESDHTTSSNPAPAAEPVSPPPPPVPQSDQQAPSPKPVKEKHRQLKGDEAPPDETRNAAKPDVQPPVTTAATPTPTPTPVGSDASPVIPRPTLGSSVIRVPSTMKEGRESIAQLIVSPTDLQSLLKQSAVTSGTGDVKDAEQNIRLTPRMRASLSAPGFDFTPKDAQEQVVKSGEPTVWVWTLVPSRTGSLTLVFTLEGILTVDGKETAIRPPALTVPVRVEVNPLLFFEKYWQWLMTAIVIPLVVFFGKRYFDRRATAAAKA